MVNLSNVSDSTNTSGSTNGPKNFRKKLLNKPLKQLTNQNEVKNLSTFQPAPAQIDDDTYLMPVDNQNENGSQQQRPKYNEATV